MLATIFPFDCKKGLRETNPNFRFQMSIINWKSTNKKQGSFKNTNEEIIIEGMI